MWVVFLPHSKTVAVQIHLVFLACSPCACMGPFCIFDANKQF